MFKWNRMLNMAYSNKS